MTGASIADLAVLGIAGEGPIQPDRITTVARALAPELWQPTVNVIDRAIERNLNEGFLRHTGNHLTDAHLAITNEGSEKVRALLLRAPELLSPSAALAAEAIQFCFLDATDEETAGKVLSRFQAKVQDRLAAFERRCAQCPYGGRYTKFWMDMEQRRLETMVRFLAAVSREATPPGTEPHIAAEVTQ